jgi:polyferredoxin
VWNFFTHEPMTWWLIIGGVQTFVLIPGLIYFYGKGAYCGWVCSCGALAETLGDRHRHKMPHGPEWNRVNFVGQAVLLVVVVMMVFRIVSWSTPDSGLGQMAGTWFDGMLNQASVFGVPLNYYYVVDVTLAGIIGVGFYFWFSGRVWCRFACPLAALMHIYARFTTFRIFPDKKKCISCNVCTSVCHQGIDVMSFANKGLPMEDPECVRCSACVQSCPTGVLSFGRQTASGLVRFDTLQASAVRAREATSRTPSAPTKPAAAA